MAQETGNMDHSGMGHEMSEMAYDKMRMDGATVAPAELGMLARLRAGDLSIPAGRVHRQQALVLADCTAAGQPDPVEVTEVSP